MPKISVIIPVYNHGDELAACLRSLERQTVKDFETIIVDDGSMTPVLDSRLRGNDRATLIRFDQNRGAPAARNAGFGASTGEYVIFLDADAELVPEALARMSEALDRHPEIDFAYPSFKFGFKTFKSQPFDVAVLKQGNYIHTSALIRRSAFPGFDESLRKFQDWDLFLTMAEQGKRGFFIDEILFSLKPRKTGMSQWLPSFAYDLPWHVVGWMPRLVKKYKDAERIIRQKHGIDVPVPAAASGGDEAKLFVLITLVELLSIPAAWNADLNSALAIIAGGLMLAVAYYRPTTALGLLVLEFMIGSKGRLLVYGADANNDGGVSLRIILFAAFFVGWLLARGRSASWKLPPPFLALAGLVLYASWMGLALAQPFVFADANAWGVLLLIIPILDLSRADTSFWSKIKQPIMVGIAWLVLKSIALFFLFSHAFDAAFLESVHRWVRRTGVGEITALGNGGVARIFIQSQIYALLAAVYLAVQAANRRVNRNHWAALALCLIAVLISFSRSFWIALALGFSFCAVVVLRRKSWVWFRNVFVASLLALLSVIGVGSFPLPSSTAGNPMYWFRARAEAGEAAATSRWELLPILFEKAMESPIIGHGFGATVTYQSADPRVVEKTGGLYTTYAFEWGWMDLWIKFGLLGPIVMLWLLASISKNRIDLAAVILTLAVVHVFTPYLNHPLGLLFLMLAWAVVIPAKAGIQHKT